MVAASVRRAWVNGWRCVGRYPVLWRMPVAFALAAAIFDAAAALLLRWRVTGSAEIALFPAAPVWDFSLQAGLSAILPALETVAAGWNCLVNTFPLSALAAAAFFFNASGLPSELRRTLCRRFGVRGWLLFGAVAACALSAMLKPAAILALPEFSEFLSLREAVALGGLVNALSFLFEYLLGTCLQVYLLLVALGWIRGRSFDRGRLRHFAVRRLGFVLKWSLVIMTLSLLLVHVPALVECLLVADPLEWRTPALMAWVARPVLAAVMLAFAAVQIRLVLHGDSLRGALAGNVRFLCGHGGAAFLFLAAAGFLQFAIKIVEIAGGRFLGPSAAGLAWGALWQMAAAAAGGGILAAWVCFYKDREAGGRKIVF